MFPHTGVLSCGVPKPFFENRNLAEIYSGSMRRSSMALAAADFFRAARNTALQKLLMAGDTRARGAGRDGAWPMNPKGHQGEGGDPRAITVSQQNTPDPLSLLAANLQRAARPALPARSPAPPPCTSSHPSPTHVLRPARRRKVAVPAAVPAAVPEQLCAGDHPGAPCSA